MSAIERVVGKHGLPDELCGAMCRQRYDDDGNPIPRHPCKMKAGWGTDHPGVGRCKYHWGSAPSHRLRGARMLLERRIESELGALLEELELDAANVDRLEILSDQVDRAHAMATALGVLVGRLTMSAGSPGEAATDGAPARLGAIEGLYGPDSKGDGKPHPLVTMYADWVDRAGRLAKLAKDCGLEERRVEVSEAEGAELARIVNFVISGLSLDRAQEETARALFRQAVELAPGRTTAIPTTSEES